MAEPIQSTPTPTSEFQSQFGVPPGSSDIAAECKKWENLCGELLAEREQLRADLAKVERESASYRKSLIHLMRKNFNDDFDVDLAFAHIDDKPTLEELIAELEHAPGK